MSSHPQGQDSRNKLFALMHAGVGSVNSLLSAYMCLERPTVFGELRKIQKYAGRSLWRARAHADALCVRMTLTGGWARTPSR
jgi:hypothetical protein